MRLSLKIQTGPSNSPMSRLSLVCNSPLHMYIIDALSRSAPGCRGEDEVPALPRTARDSDTAAWVASGLEERQSEEQAADRTSSEVRISGVRTQAHEC